MPRHGAKAQRASRPPRLERLRARMAQRVQARHGSEAAAQGRRSFLAHMGHEVRTPLNAIVGLTHLMRREASDITSMARLDEIGEAAGRLLAIFENVLNLAQMEAGQLTLQPEAFALDTLLSHSCARVAEAARQKGLELAIHATHLPRPLLGDVTQLTRALVSLLDNAVKFSARGVITLTVSATEGGRGHTLLRFEVRDTGVGLAAERLAALLSAPVAPTGQPQVGAGPHPGLGLATVQRLAALMGGELGAHSEPGVGSSFWFTARLEVAAAAAQAQADEPLRGRRALVVSAAPDGLAPTAAFLRLLGLRADTASGGTQALALADTAERTGTPYDVVLLDRLTPGRGGLDSLGLARALIAHAGAVMPAFILVCDPAEGTDPTYLGEARELDITSVLHKPVSQAALHGHLLRTLLDKAPDHPPAAPAPDPLVSLRMRLAGQSVLLAEDHPINQLVATRLLRQAGVEVEVAASGAEAVALCTRKHYALILMDVEMPLMDGLQATRRIRALPGYAHRPIVAMTANAFAEHRQACLSAGMNDHLSKPVDPALLYATLERWMTQPAASPTEPGPGLANRLALLQGLSPARGLRFFGGDIGTYREALCRFAQMYATGLPGDTADEPPDTRRLQREVHGLAGAAAAVGAELVQLLAMQAEAAMATVSAAPPGAEPMAPLDSLRHALLKLVVGLQQALDASEPGSHR